MFGWSKKKPQKPVTETRVVNLDDAPRVAQEARQRREESAVQAASTALHNTNDSIRELVKIHHDLDRDKVMIEEVDKRIRPLVVKGKKMLVETLRNNAIEIKPIHNYDDMIRANGELEHHLKKMGNILGKQTRIIHAFAEKYATRLKQILEEMDANRKAISKRIVQYQADESLALGVVEGVKSIHILEESVRDNYNRQTQTAAKLEEITQEISKAMGAIDTFKSSIEYAKLQDLQKTLDMGKNDRDLLISEVATQFTKISRPLDRYVHVSADKVQSALLRRVIQNPYGTMTKGEQEDVLTLLEVIRKAVATESISVKDVDKAEAAIIQTQKSIPDFVSRAYDVDELIRGVHKQIQESDPDRIERLQDRLHLLQNDMENTKRRIEDAKNAAQSAANAIPIEIASIQKVLYSLTGVRYNVKYNIPQL